MVAPAMMIPNSGPPAMANPAKRKPTKPANNPVVPPNATPRSIAGRKSVFMLTPASGRPSSGVSLFARIWIWFSSMPSDRSSSTILWVIAILGAKKY
jgi:hypothetical protein